MKNAWAAAACIAVAVAAPASASPPPSTAEAAEGLKVGTQAPKFTLEVLNTFPDGKKWGPDKWVGKSVAAPKKLVLLSFFATYCEPCKKEIPELSRLYDAYKDQGLGVMLVSIDRGNEQRQQVIDLANQHKAQFPVMHDRFQIVARNYRAERLPYMLLLDATGVVRTVHVGYNESTKGTVENEVRAALGLPPLAPSAAAAPAPAKAPASKKGKSNP